MLFVKDITEKYEALHKEALEFFEQLRKDKRRYLSSFVSLVKAQEWNFHQWKKDGIADPTADKAFFFLKSMFIASMKAMPYGRGFG